MGGGFFLGLFSLGLFIHLWENYHFQAAEKAFQKSLYEEASQHLRRCCLFWPRKIEVFLWEARINRFRGEYREAEKQLSHGKRLAGMTEPIQLEWVLLRAQTGEFSAVEKNLLQCLEENHPQTVFILEALGLCYLKELRYGPSHACLEKLLTLEPKHPRALMLRGWVREKLERTEGAHQDYVQAVELVPKKWEFRLQLAQFLLGGKKIQEAAWHLEKLREHQSNNPEVLVALGECRFLLGNLAEAEKYLDQAIARKKDNPQACYYRGQLELQKDRPDQAEAWFRKALQRDPGFALAQYSLYYCLRQQPDRKQEAAAELKKYQDQLQDAERIKKNLEKIEKSPSNAQLFQEVGEIFLRLEQDSVGLNFLHRALKLQPLHQKTHEILADYYQRKKQPEKAAQHLKMLNAPGS